MERAATGAVQAVAGMEPVATGATQAVAGMEPAAAGAAQAVAGMEPAATGAAAAWPAGGAEAEDLSSRAGAPVFNPDVDQWCDSLISVLVGGIGIVCMALFAALGTFHG